MATLFIKIFGSVLLGLLAWELLEKALWGLFIVLTIRALGGNWSFLGEVWRATGWTGVGALFLFYLLMAISSVKRHLARYERRILGEDKE